MRSSNPLFSSLTESTNRASRAPQGGYAGTTYAEQNYPPGGYDTARQQAGYAQAGAAAFQLNRDEMTPGAWPVSDNRPMTVDDVISKTGITLAVIIVGAIFNFAVGRYNPGLGIMLTGVGAIGGLITVLIAAFGKKYGSAAVTLTYAAFEGLFVGGISLMFASVTVGDGASSASVGGLIGQAVIGTIGVFLGMLYVYKTGAIKVTSRFNRMITGGIIGVLVLSIGNIVLFMFTGNNPLTDGGFFAIIFSLVCIGLASLSFLQDFNAADQLVRAGAPAKMAWGVALGLAVTLVWLYTEILRLLSYFRD